MIHTCFIYLTSNIVKKLTKGFITGVTIGKYYFLYVGVINSVEKNKRKRLK